MTYQACASCRASWDGPDGQACAWCERAIGQQLEQQRRLLLDPPGLRSSEGDVRYDELDEVAKRIWDRTRGQARGADSVVAWVERLARAVEAEHITPAEAERALRRIAR